MKYYSVTQYTALFDPETAHEKALLFWAIQVKALPLDLGQPDPELVDFKCGQIRLTLPMKAVSVVDDDDSLTDMFTPKLLVNVGLSTDLEDGLYCDAYDSDDGSREYLLCCLDDRKFDGLQSFPHHRVLELYLRHLRSASGVDMTVSGGSRRFGNDLSANLSRARMLAERFAKEREAAAKGGDSETI